MTTHQKAAGAEASVLIDKRIAELDDWRGETLARMRGLVRQVVLMSRRK